HRRLRSRQRGSTFVERHCSPQAGPLLWLLPVFIRALRKTSRPSLASLSASTKGVIATANRSAFALSQSLTTPFADPLAGFKDRNLRNGRIYTVKVFSRQFFACFIFQKVIYFLLFLPKVNAGPYSLVFERLIKQGNDKCLNQGKCFQFP